MKTVLNISFKTKPVLWMGFVLLSLTCCKSAQETQEAVETAQESTLLLVHFQEEVEGKQLLAEFDQIDQASIKRVAMAQNIVQCATRATKEELRELMGKINGHSQVISVKLAPTVPDKPSSSTNTDHSKTEPIREK